MSLAAPSIASRVLIVDDAPENLRILSESLRGDYTIMFAKNGQDALRLAAGDPTEEPGSKMIVCADCGGEGICMTCYGQDPACEDCGGTGVCASC